MCPKRVGFVEAVKLYFYNYSNFSGRSTESEFWWVVLFNMLVSIPLCIIDGIVYSVTDSFIFTYIPSGLWTLVNLVPGLSLYARRLHDTGHSALWLLISALLPVGAVFLTFYHPLLSILVWIAVLAVNITIFIFLILPSAQKNQWGEPAENAGNENKNGIVYGENKENAATVINTSATNSQWIEASESLGPKNGIIYGESNDDTGSSMTQSSLPDDE